MPSNKKIKYVLTHTLKISNKEATNFLKEGKIKINGVMVSENVLVSVWDEILLEGKPIRPTKEKLYYLFYKPRGIECTMSADIEDSLVKFIPEGTGLFHVGRLDRQSEGLLLLTNDGSISRKILGSETEKEYEVTVNPYKENDKDNQTIGTEFKDKMESGVKILGTITKPCKIKILSGEKFIITLTEGKNRQIRRMCHVQQFNVNTLKRIRIGKFEIGNLKSGELRKITEKHVF